MADFDDERTPLPPAAPFRGDDGLVTGAMPAIVPGANHPYLAARRTSRLWSLSDPGHVPAGAGADGETTRMTRAEILEAIPGMAFSEPVPERAQPLVPPQAQPSASATSKVRALRMPRIELGARAQLAIAGGALFLSGLLLGIAVG